jgi:hypothetical protein
MAKDSGQVIREWLVEKMGNPVMGSKKQAAINEIEGEDEDTRRRRALDDMQQKGEDYSARIHTRK